jgi:hypothetical protein
VSYGTSLLIYTDPLLILQGAKENISIKDGGNNRRLEKIA